VIRLRAGAALQRRPTTAVEVEDLSFEIWRLFHRGGTKLVPR
jgi:hypothetical protein